MPNTKRSIDVLYILGAGRSGSTVLEQVVSGMPGYACVGELCYLRIRGHEFDELCSCGQSFSQCPFWRRVVDRAFADDREFADFFADQAYLWRLRRLPLVCFARLRKAPFSARLERFHQTQAKLFEAVRAVSDCNVVVDSSKRAKYGYLLASNPYLNLRIIHVMRDARAVAFSWQRAKKRPEANGLNAYMPTYSAGRASRIWVFDNFLASGLRRHAKSAEILRYEDFCPQPALITASLYRQQLPTVATVVASGHGVSSDSLLPQGETHSVSGNPARLSKGPVALVKDDEWRTALTRRDRLLVTTVAGPLLIKYGYLRRKGSRKFGDGRDD